MAEVLRQFGGDSQIDFVSALNALLDETKVEQIARKE
jgi:hypothetical protein